MDLSLSKAQKMLVKSARDFLKKECQELAQEAENMPTGYSSEIWGKISELGWLGIGVPEEFGGIGGDFLEQVLVLQEMGRVSFPGPYISSAACATTLIQEFGSDAQKKEFLPLLADGEIIMVPALVKPDDFTGAYAKDSWYQNGGADSDYVFTATRLFVPAGCSADYFLVCPDSQSSKSTAAAAPMLLVDAKSPGITRTTLETIAQDKQAEVIFEQVSVPAVNAIAPTGDVTVLLKRVQEIGALAHSAYILGLLERVLEMTVDYAKQRIQFGKPIGQFQAIQHQCADMMIDMEQLKYLTYQSAWLLSQGRPAESAIAMAKARASDASRRISLLGVKIHGGIGIIDEYEMQLYFRHAKSEELAFGDGDCHREIVAQQLGL